ncbi:MAG TPA: ribosomal protein S18-alanine N-acetyltransferase [Gallionellaceae bacterium]|nr:ribosomal protein S18-alanine N-acetyltransferase [Gallionellaceae bacterium]
MSAAAAQLRDMGSADIDAVLAIEQQVHAHPWTRGNFSDALESGYVCKVYEREGMLLGYAVLMRNVDEAELLAIAIAAEHQRQGWGLRLLQEMKALAQVEGRQRLLLEVRASNAPAIALYRRAGFGQIGLRKHYYPAAPGREDAILMGCDL